MLEWLEQLDEDQQATAIRAAFQKVAATQEGAIVFAVLFEQLHFFRPCHDPAAQVLANYCKDKLLTYFGDNVHTAIIEAILANAAHAELVSKEEREGEKNGD